MGFPLNERRPTPTALLHLSRDSQKYGQKSRNHQKSLGLSVQTHILDRPGQKIHGGTVERLRWLDTIIKNGWTLCSPFGRDNEDAVLILHGIKNPEEQNGTLTLRACPNCGEKNEPATIRCIRCGLILDQKMAYELRNEEEKKREQMLNRIENLEKLVLSVLNQKASV